MMEVNCGPCHVDTSGQNDHESLGAQVAFIPLTALCAGRPGYGP